MKIKTISLILVLSTARTLIAQDTDGLSRRTPPAISIRKAIEIAEEHYSRTEDKREGRFIEQVHYVEHNLSQPSKGAFWVVRFVPPTRSIGGEVFMSIYMDGTISVMHGR